NAGDISRPITPKAPRSKLHEYSPTSPSSTLLLSLRYQSDSAIGQRPSCQPLRNGPRRALHECGNRHSLKARQSAKILAHFRVDGLIADHSVPAPLSTSASSRCTSSISTTTDADRHLRDAGMRGRHTDCRRLAPGTAFDFSGDGNLRRVTKLDDAHVRWIDNARLTSLRKLLRP